MRTGDYKIVRYRPEFAEAVARLHSVHMPNGSAPLSARYLDWKYDGNPYIPAKLIYLALQGGEVVAMRGFFGSCWEARGARVIMPSAGDLVVATAHQNRGLIAQIMTLAFTELREMGFSHILSLGAGDVAAMNARALGFKSIARMERQVRLRRFTLAWSLWQLSKVFRSLPKYEALRRRVRSAFAGFRSVTGDPRTVLRRFDAAAGSTDLGTGLQGGSELRPEAMAELVERVGRKERIRHVRDAAFFRWRYASSLHDYRFVYSGGKRLDGYLALSAVRGDPAPSVCVADWEGETPEVKRKLLSAAINAGQFRHLSTWKFGMGPEEISILQSCGLVPEPATPGVKGRGLTAFVKALAPERDGMSPFGDVALLKPQNWDYRMIFSDVV